MVKAFVASQQKAINYDLTTGAMCAASKILGSAKEGES